MFWHIYVVCFQPDLPWSIDHFPSRCHQVLTLTFGMMFFCICLGLLTVGSSQVQTQNWKQLQLATNHETNHVWNRMLVFFFVARCWERVQFFLTGLCSFFGEADGDGGVRPQYLFSEKLYIYIYLCFFSIRSARARP